jgi:hypothetical protein
VNETSKFLLAGVFVALVFFILRPGGKGSTFSFGAITSNVGGNDPNRLAANLSGGNDYLKILASLERNTLIASQRATCFARGGDIVLVSETRDFQTYSCKAGADTLWNFNVTVVP